MGMLLCGDVFTESNGLITRCMKERTPPHTEHTDGIMAWRYTTRDEYQLKVIYHNYAYGEAGEHDVDWDTTGQAGAESRAPLGLALDQPGGRDGDPVELDGLG